jgi:hypothetical protein
MRKIIESLLVLACLCLPASAQINDACRADLRHLKLPEHAFIDDVIGLDQPPLAFLFSEDGVDVYSATAIDAMREWNRAGLPPVDDAITVILVYQEEQVRQRKIESLRKDVARMNYLLRYRRAPLENLKFSTWRFELTAVWVNNVLTRQWLISGVAYFEPVSCEPVKSRIPASRNGYLEASISCNNSIIGAMPPVMVPKDQWGPPAPNSVLAHALEGMQHVFQVYGLPN